MQQTNAAKPGSTARQALFEIQSASKIHRLGAPDLETGKEVLGLLRELCDRLRPDDSSS